MEHQSAIAYGNHYINGYLGRDLSGTGQGLDWDFIIVHESAHEWWGNSLTTADLADMWVHEGFANYSEGLYVECLRGKAAGAEYNIGNRKGIKNTEPITPPYGVNREGSGDMYPKGGNMLHTIRQVIDNDELWRQILRGLQQEFRHQIVTAHQVEAVHRPEVGHRLHHGVPAVPHDHDGTGARVPDRGLDPVVPLGGRGPQLQPADPGHAVRHRLHGDPSDRRVADGKAVAAESGHLHAVDPNYYVESKRVNGM